MPWFALISSVKKEKGNDKQGDERDELMNSLTVENSPKAEV